MPTQQAITFNGKIHTVNVNKFQRIYSESKGDELKTKVEATVGDAIRAFCRGRQITVADFLREYSRLGDEYFDHIETLLSEKETLLPLLERLSKKN